MDPKSFCKPSRIKEVHSKVDSFQASLCTLTATHLTLVYVCTNIRPSVPSGCLRGGGGGGGGGFTTEILENTISR